MTTPNGQLEEPKSQAPIRLLLRAADAAEALGLGTRKLWELTNRGIIPCVRIDSRAVRYVVADLERWVEGLPRQGLGGGSPSTGRDHKRGLSSLHGDTKTTHERSAAAGHQGQ